MFMIGFVDAHGCLAGICSQSKRRLRLLQLFVGRDPSTKHKGERGEGEKTRSFGRWIENEHERIAKLTSMHRRLAQELQDVVGCFMLLVQRELLQSTMAGTNMRVKCCGVGVREHVWGRRGQTRTPHPRN